METSWFACIQRKHEVSMKQAHVLTDGEFKRVLAVIAQGRHARRNRLAVLLSHYAGLRVGEIAALTFGDMVDAQGKVREQLRLRAETTKGGRARMVPLSTQLRREITEYVQSLSVLPIPDVPLLQTQKRTAFSSNTLCQLLGKLYHEAGIDGASSHSGRRWFITRLAHSGISPKVIMTLAGHASLATTQLYIDVRDEMLKAAVERL
jgi:integrase/recombinase XerD